MQKQYLTWVVSLLSVLSVQNAWADSVSVTRVRDLSRPATTVKEWLAQVEAATVQVTRVTLNPTDAGLEIVVETAEGKLLQVDATKFRTEGNSLIAVIPNAVLALPEAQEFTATNPIGDITSVRVTQLDTSSIRISVAGRDALPTTEVTLRTGDFAYSLNPEAETEPDEEIVVTGEGAGRYRVPNASTATRTDTPIRDIPQSIQVVPQQVIQDQAATGLEDVLRNVSGVSTGGSSNFFAEGFISRGSFNTGNSAFRNGLRSDEPGRSTIADVDHVEVLKGPSSVLYGQGIGTIINVITKKPLFEPYYAIDFTVGNYNFYQPTVDLSGPLNAQKTIAYRLIGSYQNSGSFVDFFKKERWLVAPSISINFSPNTKLLLEASYQNDKYPDDFGLPAIGTILNNPNGKLPINRTISEPGDSTTTEFHRIGYTLEHQFNAVWKLRNVFQFQNWSQEDIFASADSLEPDLRTLNRNATEGVIKSNIFNVFTDIEGNFKTGSVAHKLLIGVEYFRRDEFKSQYFDPAFIAPLDLFNPVYGTVEGPYTVGLDAQRFYNTWGLYLQDQITLLPNLKLLLGGRYDWARQKIRDRLAETEERQLDQAFSPRVGVVYQPIEPVSLYASWTRSFQPNEGRNFDNQLFDPERGEQFEVGVKADIAQKLFATLAFYQLDRSNVLTTDLDNFNFSIQTGKRRSRGIEFDLAGEILPGWNIIASYAYTDSRITKDNYFPVGTLIDNVPRHGASLWTTYTLQKGPVKGLGFGFGVFYVGEREGDLNNSFQLPSYLRTDAAIFYKRDQLRLALNLKNLFNVRYFEATYGSDLNVYYGAPFTVQGTISLEF